MLNEQKMKTKFHRSVYNTIRLTLEPLNKKKYIFIHLKLYLATATHNFAWVVITKNNLFNLTQKTFENVDISTFISIPIPVIFSVRQ